MWRIVELFYRETHSETTTNDTNGEVNKESDSDEPPRYTSLQANNPTYATKKVDDDDAIYENP